MSTVVKINNKLKLPSETNIITNIITKLNKLNEVKHQLYGLVSNNTSTIITHGKIIYVKEELSIKFLNIIKDIFKEYISFTPCEKIDNNSIECENLKFKYYSILKKVLTKNNILAPKIGGYDYTFYKGYKQKIEAEIYKFHSQIDKEIKNYFNFKKFNKEAIKCRKN